MRTLLSLALLAALAALISTPAAAQRHLSPRIEQLNSNDGLRLVQTGDTKSKKKKKKDGGGQNGSGGGAPSGGGSSY